VSEVTSSQNVNGSNTGGVDYTAGPYYVTFPAGDTSLSFDVPITDDNLFESDESLQLSIVRRSLPNGVTRGNPGRVKLTVVDNDCKCCSETYNPVHLFYMLHLRLNE